MKRGIGVRLVAILLLTGLLGTSAGCKPWLLASHVVSFGLGWVSRDLTMLTATERLCYRNGELVDCADLPAQTAE